MYASEIKHPSAATCAPGTARRHAQAIEEAERGQRVPDRALERLCGPRSSQPPWRGRGVAIDVLTMLEPVLKAWRGEDAAGAVPAAPPGDAAAEPVASQSDAARVPARGWPIEIRELQREYAREQERLKREQEVQAPRGIAGMVCRSAAQE